MRQRSRRRSLNWHRAKRARFRAWRSRKLRFTLRDLFWLLLVLAMTMLWWRDHSALARLNAISPGRQTIENFGNEIIYLRKQLRELQGGIHAQGTDAQPEDR